MKKTEGYKFNLIEPSDTFSPAPLNENMETVEEQLNAVRAECDESDAALDQRLQVLEARKLVWGAYTGNGAVRTFDLGFAPDLVYVQGRQLNVTLSALATQTAPYYTNFLVLTSNGFTLGNHSSGFNVQGREYIYVALKR